MHACVLTILPIHSQRIDLTLRHLRVMINIIFIPTDRLHYGEWSGGEGVASQARRVYGAGGFICV